MALYDMFGPMVSLTPATVGAQGVAFNLKSAYQSNLDGIKVMQRKKHWGAKKNEAFTRTITYAFPGCSSHPGTYAGSIMYLPTGKYFQDPSMKMHALPTRQQYEIKLPFGITGDPMARPQGLMDYYVLRGDDTVLFFESGTKKMLTLEKTGDMKMDRYGGPAGYEGLENLDSFWDAPGGAPMRSREVDFIPMNDAFSTIHSMAPMRRIGEGSKEQSGLGCRPTDKYGYFKDQNMRGCATQDASQCCGYGFPDANLPFPRENIQASRPPFGHP